MQMDTHKATTSPVSVTLALLHPPLSPTSDNPPTFLMQLRDDKPEILYPGHWGLFGGHLDPGETPDDCIHRELIEEIGHDVNGLEVFRIIEDSHVIRYVYSGILTFPDADIILGEGMDFKLVSVEELQQGTAWSEAIAETRPMGDFHRNILLEFWETLK